MREYEEEKFKEENNVVSVEDKCDKNYAVKKILWRLSTSNLINNFYFILTCQIRLTYYFLENF